MADEMGDPSSTRWRAPVLAVTGVALVLAAGWFAAGWIADPPDETCGSVFRPEHWRDRDGCQTVMSLRSAVSIGIAGLGLGVFVLAVRGRVRLATRLAVPAVAVATVALALNEAVRNTGLLL